MDRVTLAGLVRVTLPDTTIRLCDGAFVIWGEEIFDAEDTTFGTIGNVEPIEEGVGDELPALRMLFLPKSTAAAAELSQPAWQGCRVQMWIAEVDPSTHAVVGDPEMMFDGMLDSTELVFDRGSRVLNMEIVTTADRLFLVNEGNNLSPRFHKSLFPGELGEDNATGVGVGVAWGTSLPAQTYGPGFGGGGGGAGGGYGGGRLDFGEWQR